MAKLKVMKVSSKNPAYAKVKISVGILGGKVGWTWLDQDLEEGEETDIDDSFYHNCKVIPIELGDGKIANTLEF